MDNCCKLKLKVSEKTKLKLKIGGVGFPVYPEAYSGDYNVTPSQTPQILKTGGLMMTNDVVIDKIPDYYGLITWNGSFIRVS